MSKPLKNPEKNWGTDPSYWRIKVHTSEIEEKDLEYMKSLTAEQRLEWLLMMQDLLFKQYYPD